MERLNYDVLETHEWHSLGGDIHHDLTDNKYYFADETYDLNGPYETEAEAKAGLLNYVKYL